MKFLILPIDVSDWRLHFFFVCCPQRLKMLLQRGRVFLTAGAANEKKKKFENEHIKHF
jgi:hypothetical protein